MIYFKLVLNGYKKIFYIFLSCGFLLILVKGFFCFLIYEFNGILGFEVIFKCLFERFFVCKKKREKKIDNDLFLLFYVSYR